LREINLSLRNLLKVTVILKDISDFQGMHNGWKQVFSASYPVRTTITSDFVDEQCLIQIDGIAGIEAEVQNASELLRGM
jgi:2-iminobutanoate/2-iminopropanoate deaminase